MSGDKRGNLRVHELGDFKLLAHLAAHDEEVRSLAFTTTAAGRPLLASGSRDRFVHLVDLSSPNELHVLNSFHAHEAAVTGLLVYHCQVSRLSWSCAQECALPRRAPSSSRAAPTARSNSARFGSARHHFDPVM